MKKLLALVALFCSLFLVAGCTGQTGGTAAIVDGVKISDAKVGEIAQALHDVDPQRYSAVEMRHDALTGLLQGKVADKIEAQTGKHADEAAVDAILKKFGAVSGNATVREWLRGPARLQALSEGMDEKQFFEVVRGMNVEVNPRYGNWNPDMLIAQPGNRSLSEKYSEQ